MPRSIARIAASFRPCRLAMLVLVFSEPLALAAASCGSSELQALVRTSASADAYVNLGQSFGSRKDFNCAADAFAAAFRLQPTSASVAYLWGLSLSSAGEEERAVVPLQEAIRLDASDIRPHLLLAAVLDRMHKAAEAETEWRRALNIDPQSTIALDSLSQQLVDRKDYASTIALLDRPGLEQNRTAAQSLSLGMAYAGRVQLDQAARVLREGLNDNEDSLPIANELALVLMLLGRNEEAYSVFDLALAKHPGDAATQVLYLHAMVTGKSDRAFDYSRTLLAASPNQWEVLYLAGVLESRKGAYAAAREHLEHSVLLNPKYYQSQQLLGSVLSRLGDLVAARQHLEQAIALGDDQPEAEYELAQVLKKMGKMTDAQERLQRYQEIKQNRSDSVEAAGKAEMGDQALSEGNPFKAASLYREAIAVSPQQSILFYKLSQAQEKLKDFGGEKTSLERAIQLDPNLAEAQNQLGYLADRAGDLAQAESYFRSAIRVSPSYVIAWINLAATLAAEERWQDAKEILRHVSEIDPGNTQAQQLAQALSDTHPNYHH